MISYDFISGGEIEIITWLQFMQRSLSKLPAYFQSHPVFQQVYSHINQSKVMHGMILYKNSKGRFLILKDGTIHVPFDWQVYSLMRAAAQLSINTGQTLRHEREIYLRRESYGDRHVDQLFQALVGRQAQKVMVCTRKMTESQILQFFNPQLYELVGLSKDKSICSLIDEASKTYEHPILLQIGLNALGTYFREVQKGGPNNLDTLVITSYQGPLAPQFIGQKLELPLEKYYEKAWVSEKIPCTLHDSTPGELEFEILKVKK